MTIIGRHTEHADRFMSVWERLREIKMIFWGFLGVFLGGVFLGGVLGFFLKGKIFYFKIIKYPHPTHPIWKNMNLQIMCKPIPISVGHSKVRKVGFYIFLYSQKF